MFMNKTGCDIVFISTFVAVHVNVNSFKSNCEPSSIVKRKAEGTEIGSIDAVTVHWHPGTNDQRLNNSICLAKID